MRYLAIGDGLCSGNGAPFMTPNLIYRHARLAEEKLKERVHVTTIARSNYRSKDISDLLEDEYVMNRIKESDMIVLSAGHEDFLDAMEVYEKDENDGALHKALKTCKSNVDDIIYGIRELKADQDVPYMLTILGMHNPFHEHHKAEKWIKHYNKHLDCRASTPHINAVNLHHHFRGKLNNWCTNDLLYPNHEGHHEIAQQLHEIGYAPILRRDFQEKE